ncbi:hypothetical protein B0675_40235 [Streptomyces sp. M41(2017)]|uniref:hypothetical protein n=1 Tax=Streptomyces sp. M41(2017) TaxID=1955065 RepID=UPI0009BF6093|nr:hypothetical protein [Streptomyces sp. M41(2017)]OQQ13049.1 hypothetical protein B0675_40235 [Streptomyces sp. M41(2017)]
MKCDEPHEGNEFAGCTKELGHAGDHEHFGTRWPRPVPSGELSDRVLKLLPGGWGHNEREFYLAFEVTSVYLIPVSAESEDEALEMCGDGSDLPDFNRYQAVDGDVSVRRPYLDERTGMTGSPIGPKIACPGCGELAMSRSWYHRPLRKCHGPIEWTVRTSASGKPWASRKHEAHAGRQAAS